MPNSRRRNLRPIQDKDPSNQRIVRPIYVAYDQLHRQRNPRDPRIQVVFRSRIVPASQLAKIHSKIYSKT